MATVPESECGNSYEMLALRGVGKQAGAVAGRPRIIVSRIFGLFGSPSDALGMLAGAFDPAGRNAGDAPRAADSDVARVIP